MLCKRAFLGGAMDKEWLQVRIPSSIDILQDSIREKPAWFYDMLQNILHRAGERVIL